jgi:hypothetical protein
MPRPTREWLRGGPKRQFNVRMPVSLRSEIEALAKARGVKVTKVALALLEDAVFNKCRRCAWASPPAARSFIQSRFCRGTGRLDVAKADRKAAKSDV